MLKNMFEIGVPKIKIKNWMKPKQDYLHRVKLNPKTSRQKPSQTPHQQLLPPQQSQPLKLRELFQPLKELPQELLRGLLQEPPQPRQELQLLRELLRLLQGHQLLRELLKGLQIFRHQTKIIHYLTLIYLLRLQARQKTERIMLQIKVRRTTKKQQKTCGIIGKKKTKLLPKSKNLRLTLCLL